MKRSFLPAWLRRPVLPTALAAVLLLPGCGTGLFPDLDQQEPKQYALSSAEQAWAAPYRLGEEWRFRNARSGYERRYQVKSLSDQELPGVAEGTQRLSYFQQGLSARLERVDSAYVQRLTSGRFAGTFTMMAAAPAQALSAELGWGPYHVALPVTALETQQTLPIGLRLLPTATFGGRTYTQVIEYTISTPADVRAAWSVKQIYYTKDRGVVRFVEVGGEAWDRQ